ncbi:hypothetical protein ACFV06_21360 [Streptomyces sp. NPDC059618]|uniref:hypothetical protein n=1 Tax=Streptomyces sp. NPDC059618 TaxID=3346887 RepID=UPI0036C6572D
MTTSHNPSSLDLAMRPDSTHRQTVQVGLPTRGALPKIDVYFLTDSTGSMTPIIDAVKNGAAKILNDVQDAAQKVHADLWFGVGNYRDVVDGDRLFTNQVPLTNDTAATKRGIEAWDVGGGGNTPEGQLYALDQLAQPPGSSIGWREDSKRIIVWFGDAPGNDPIRSTDNPLVTYDITEDSVIRKLQWEQIFVLAISTLTSPSAPGLNHDPASLSSTGRPDQGMRVATATRGTYSDGIDAARIVEKIIGLGAEEVRKLKKVMLVPDTSVAPFVRVNPADGHGPFSSGAGGTADFDLEFPGATTTSRSASPALPAADRRIAVRGDIEVQIDGVITGKIPVTFLEPAECALEIVQETPMTAKPGETVLFNMLLSGPPGRSVDPGTITQKFTAPTGFVFVRGPSYAHYPGDRGNLSYKIENSGKRLVISGNPHVDTTPTDRSPLVYTIVVKAEETATPGTYDDGHANIGSHPAVPLTGVVIPGEPLTVTQEAVPTLKPGQSATVNIWLDSRESPFTARQVEQTFTAPTGFRFTGGVSYGYYMVSPHRTGNLTSTTADDGRTVTVKADLHLNNDPATDREPVIYTFTLMALPEAEPGTHSDGKALIGPDGSFGSAAISATADR